MALLGRSFYRKPPDRLLEISDRVYVFDCCFSTNVLGEDEYRTYMNGIVAQLQDLYPDAAFMFFNFKEGESRSHLSDLLSQYDMTVMDYPQHYARCPLLPLETIHHFLQWSENWLSVEGQQHILLMLCERGGWPVLAFMLAGLLLYRKQFTGEQKTLEMVYKQAPGEVLYLLTSLNPQPSQLRYLQYITRRNLRTSSSVSLALDCVALRVLPLYDEGQGCRPVVRVYGRDSSSGMSDISSRLLFSSSAVKKHFTYYQQVLFSDADSLPSIITTKAASEDDSKTEPDSFLPPTATVLPPLLTLPSPPLPLKFPPPSCSSASAVTNFLSSSLPPLSPPSLSSPVSNENASFKLLVSSSPLLSAPPQSSIDASLPTSEQGVSLAPSIPPSPTPSSVENFSTVIPPPCCAVYYSPSSSQSPLSLNSVSLSSIAPSERLYYFPSNFTQPQYPLTGAPPPTLPFVGGAAPTSMLSCMLSMSTPIFVTPIPLPPYNEVDFSFPHTTPPTMPCSCSCPSSISGVAETPPPPVNDSSPPLKPAPPPPPPPPPNSSEILSPITPHKSSAPPPPPSCGVAAPSPPPPPPPPPQGGGAAPPPPSQSLSNKDDFLPASIPQDKEPGWPILLPHSVLTPSSEPTPSLPVPSAPPTTILPFVGDAAPTSMLSCMLSKSTPIFVKQIPVPPNNEVDFGFPHNTPPTMPCSSSFPSPVTVVMETPP